MGNFDHYPDMNHDGEHDLYDCAVFHAMMEEEEASDSNDSAEEELEMMRISYWKNMTDAQRAEARLERQVEEFTRWLFIIILGIILIVCLKNLSVFSFIVGIMALTGLIRMLTL